MNVLFVCSVVASLEGIPCSNGEVRLAGGLTESQGRVEICYNNQWGTICHDFWGNNEATVACRRLGYATVGKCIRAVIYMQ